MKTRLFVALGAVPLVVAAMLLSLSVAPLAGAAPPAPTNTETRPIADFVDAQGTFCIDDGMGGCLLFVPPVENYIGWTDPKNGLSISVDYAGIADDFYGGAFGTTFGGTVTERALADGRAEVMVVLHTKNALTWVVAGSDFASDALVFGARPTPGGLEGPAVALGSSELLMKFINTAPGAPLPDLLQLFIAPAAGQVPLSIGITAMAGGEFADGSPARTEVVQTGLFFTSANGNSRVALDGFPAEYIKLSAVGK